jgi:hypothetical protein
MKKLALISLIGLFLVFAVACGSGDGSAADTGKAIQSAPAGNNLTATLSNKDGVLKHGNVEFTLTFKDASGKPVEVGAVALTFHMPAMGTMPVMNSAATFTTTGTPGVYRGTANIETAGEWQVQVTYEGPAGKGQAKFSVTAQ